MAEHDITRGTAGSFRRAVISLARKRPVPDPGRPATDGTVVGWGYYIDGVRQQGDWNMVEALGQARRKNGGFVWIGLEAPKPVGHTGEVDIPILDELAETFGLHPLTLEDAGKPAQRAKIERYENMMFAVVRTARYVEHTSITDNSEVVETGVVMMYIGADFVITVRHGDACKLRSVREDLERNKELLAYGPWAVAHAVFDSIVDTYLDVADKMEVDLDAVEELVFSRDGHSRIQHIYQLKRELVEFKRAVNPLQRPLAQLVGGQINAEPEVPLAIRQYFRDVADHLSRVVEQTSSYDDLLNSVLQARLAQVTVDQNNDMRKIAAWAGIAAVQTTIAGIYGMNFDVMPELRWKFGYPIILGVMLASVLVLHRVFRRAGWL